MRLVDARPHREKKRPPFPAETGLEVQAVSTTGFLQLRGYSGWWNPERFEDAGA